MRGKDLLRNTTSATLLTLVVTFFWGSLYPMVPLGYKTFAIDTSNLSNILLYAGLRFTLCGSFLVGAVSLRDKRLAPPDRSVLPAILTITLFTYVLHYICNYVAMGHLESSKTAIIKQIGSLFLICFAFLFRKEDRFTAAKLIGGLLGFASILVINMQGLTLSFSVYDLLVIGASFFATVGVILAKNAYDRHDPIYVTAWAQLMGGLILLLSGPLTGGSFGRFDLSSVLVMAYTCLASCAGYALWNSLLKYNDMSRMNVIKFAEPLFGGLCSWVLLGENVFRVTYLLSLILVCVGILIGTGRIALPGKKNNP